jgi:four helix bundle protein
MKTIQQFEDIQAWQRARSFCAQIDQVAKEGKFARDFALRDQINRSSGSIMDNIAEGFERGGNKEFINFLSYAKGSNGESKSQLYRAFDRNYISKDKFDVLSNDSTEIGRMIGGFIHYLQSTAYRGTKFKDRSNE